MKTKLDEVNKWNMFFIFFFLLGIQKKDKCTNEHMH